MEGRNDELEVLKYIDRHVEATGDLHRLWRSWVLGHSTDQELQAARDEWQHSYHNLCDTAQLWQERHIEARRETRRRYLAECEGVVSTEGSPLTPYGERLEGVKHAIEKVSEATGQENYTIAGLVEEGVLEVAEHYLRRNAEREKKKAKLYADRTLEELQFCGCKDCRAELLRRLNRYNNGSAPSTPQDVPAATTDPNPPSPSGKSALLQDLLQAMAERRGLKAAQASPRLWGLYTDPVNPPSTPTRADMWAAAQQADQEIQEAGRMFKKIFDISASEDPRLFGFFYDKIWPSRNTAQSNGAGPGEGLDTQAGHDDWGYGRLRSSREAPPDNDGNGYYGTEPPSYTGPHFPF